MPIAEKTLVGAAIVIVLTIVVALTVYVAGGLGYISGQRMHTVVDALVLWIVAVFFVMVVIILPLTAPPP
jgi:uncharacterized membrane protein YdjX (TVP38/TMEM64 family)